MSIKRKFFGCLALGLLAGFGVGLGADQGQAAEVDLAKAKLVDLTHTYNDSTIYWPNAPTRFQHKVLSFGHTEGGWFYSAYSFCSPEHGGTHLDAPIHFDEKGESVDEVAPEKLIGPAVVIDISEKAAEDPDYRLTVEDVTGFEAAHGAIEENAIVLLRTGWSQRWPDVKAYLGDDRPGRTDALHFPSFGEAAARLLLEERGAKMIGVDTASIDYGQSKNFIVHQIAGAHNISGLENLTNLGRLPPKGAVVMALPMKIGEGSGGPVRVIAMIPEEAAQ